MKKEVTKNLVRGHICLNCKWRNVSTSACLIDVDFENKQNWEDSKKFPKEMTCDRWEIRKKKGPRRGEMFFDKTTLTTQIFDGTLWLEMK